MVLFESSQKVFMEVHVKSESCKLPRVAVVIVTRNRCDILSRLLSQIGKLDYPAHRIDIFVVDNASTDNTAKIVQELFPWVHLKITSRNLGISAGFNLGIQDALAYDKAVYEYIWLLDDDAVLDNMTLRTLVESSETDPKIAVVGSAVYDIDKPEQLVSAGFMADWQRAGINYHIPEGKTGKTLFDVDLVAACSLFAKTVFYKKLGLWDERFWLYWGDTEWCTRISKMGYKICCETKSRVWHRNWAMVEPHFFSPVLIYDRVRGALLFNLCHNPEGSIAGVRHMIMKSYLKALAEVFTRRPFFSQALIDGVRDFIKGNFFQDDNPSWIDSLENTELPCIYGQLRGNLGQNVTIILNQIKKKSQRVMVKENFEKCFNNINWTEIPIKKNIRKPHLSDHYREYFFFHIPRFIIRLPLLFNRRDLIISDIANPDMYNILAAKYTMFIDSSCNVSVVENRLCGAAADAIRIICEGIWACFVQLPGIKEKHESLKQTANL